MSEFFVWSRPGLINLIEAENEQDAAEEFLGQPATRAPILDEPPACFVQITGGLNAPRMDETAVEFWIVDEDPIPS